MLFSADELQRAKNVGLRVERLVEGHEYGLTFEEMIKFQELRSSTRPPGEKNATLEEKVWCEEKKNIDQSQ